METNARARILIIDDEPDVLATLREGLSSLGYQIVTASSGKEGLEKFSQGNIDLVLCDLVMPGLNGTEVLERILRLDENVPVVMITGHPTIETAVDAMAEGAYDYIVKPFGLATLELRIRRTLSAKAAEQRAKSSKVLSLILLLSIPLWVILGLVLALLFR